LAPMQIAATSAKLRATISTTAMSAARMTRQTSREKAFSLNGCTVRPIQRLMD